MAIPETSNATISAPLLKELEATAQAEGRTVVDVLADAVRSYIDDRKWQSLVARGERRAKANDLREADVPRLIEEVRSENRTRGL